MTIVFSICAIIFVAIVVGSFNVIEKKIDVLNRNVMLLYSTIELLHAKEQMNSKGNGGESVE